MKWLYLFPMEDFREGAAFALFDLADRPTDRDQTDQFKMLGSAQELRHFPAIFFFVARDPAGAKAQVRGREKDILGCRGTVLKIILGILAENHDAVGQV